MRSYFRLRSRSHSFSNRAVIDRDGGSRVRFHMGRNRNRFQVICGWR
jgi:hypothetical protein